MDVFVNLFFLINHKNIFYKTSVKEYKIIDRFVLEFDNYWHDILLPITFKFNYLILLSRINWIKMNECPFWVQLRCVSYYLIQYL